MFLLLERHPGKRFSIYCPEIYGCESWGSLDQHSIVKKRTHWYFTHWSYRGEYQDDINEETRINIVLETEDFEEILEYVKIRNKKELEHLIADYDLQGNDDTTTD